MKYIRTDMGFTVWPEADGIHFVVSKSLMCRPVSAGFVRWHDGLPECYGRSESLDLDSDPGDTDALRAAWGLVAQPVGEWPRCKACNGNIWNCAACHPAKPVGVPVGMNADVMYDAIKEVLSNYRMTSMVDKDGDPYPLIDALSTPSFDISTGAHEILLICDAIYNEVLLVSAPAVELPVVPQGWPEEPTPEMQGAGAGAIRFDTSALNKLWTANAVYRAIREVALAAPAPLVEPVEIPPEVVLKMHFAGKEFPFQMSDCIVFMRDAFEKYLAGAKK